MIIMMTIMVPSKGGRRVDEEQRTRNVERAALTAKKKSASKRFWQMIRLAALLREPQQGLRLLKCLTKEY